MKLLLNGTAGGAGWPEPGCSCVSCAGLPAEHRRPFELVVDGVARYPFTGPPSGYRPLAGGLGLAGPDGTMLVHLPAGRTPPPDGPARYDVVLIDLLDRPERLGALRRAGLADDATLVVAVGLDHRVRSEEELARRLRLWRAIAVPDGTELACRPAGRSPGDLADDVTSRAGNQGSARVGLPRRTLLLGGARSGKSAEAELRLAAEPYVTYVATGPTGGEDGEWAERVGAHRERRPAHWVTAETTDLATAITGATTPLLIDGLGTWVAAVFDEYGAWEGDRAPVVARCDDLVAAWRRAPEPIVAVSDEVGLGVVPATAAGRAFRDVLGRLNERLAAESEHVALVVAGRPLEL
ncbi:bifunctional adenosylcobinamide kinase/adenosylcobinamide-phosphate guanylyltransferase [Nonomuraea longispora]|uniref:Adenosylcobinamide kinase n=1 Tax=Nonomuraea longispora TaxID=1848320 RepID=A0A4V2XIU8_9ACTN|nr:bifunctional adenosylcobinamide kinase/adenosylcobinamide-phosphate guanylyltransferase [Nonomuraea longispora]TDB99615.1 bifunctional adenosylcobinamide kinase/adenosylcobinamide-phosphate guanylyltransferase [Nonomuraea longispora]